MTNLNTEYLKKDIIFEDAELEAELLECTLYSLRDLLLDGTKGSYDGGFLINVYKGTDGQDIYCDEPIGSNDEESFKTIISCLELNKIFEEDKLYKVGINQDDRPVVYHKGGNTNIDKEIIGRIRREEF